MNKRIFKDQTTEEGDIPFYKIGTFGEKPDAFISRELFEEYKEKYPYPKVGDLLISASGSIGRTVEYKGEDAYYQDSNIVWLDHDDRLDNSFLKQLYRKVKWKGLEGSTIKRLYNKNILSTDVNIPSVNEQKSIGTFFRKIDDTIALHEEKLAQLQQLKKGLLQKMFADNNQQVPVLRFNGFDDAWEQHKLGDIASIFSGGTPSISHKEYYGGNIPFIRSAEINSKTTELFLTEQGLNNSSAKRVESGDILYALYGATSGEVGISKINGAINQAILDIKPSEEYNSYFIMQWLRNNKSRIVNTYLQGGQGNLSGKIIKELMISSPKTKEQQKIGIFLQKLDTTITLHQRELDTLKKVKKYLLQNLFI